MFITPMIKVNDISSLGLGASQQTSQQAQVPFQTVFQNAIKDVVDTDHTVSQDVTALTTGQSDDLHNLEIDISKAQLSLNLMVQLRNKAMDAYTEVMRMSL